MPNKKTLKKTSTNGQKPATKNLSATIPTATWLRAKEVLLHSQVNGPVELTWDSLITRALECFMNGQQLEQADQSDLDRILTESVTGSEAKS